MKLILLKLGIDCQEDISRMKVRPFLRFHMESHTSYRKKRGYHKSALFIGESPVRIDSINFLFRPLMKLPYITVNLSGWGAVLMERRKRLSNQ